MRKWGKLSVMFKFVASLGFVSMIMALFLGRIEDAFLLACLGLGAGIVAYELELIGKGEFERSGVSFKLGIFMAVLVVLAYAGSVFGQVMQGIAVLGFFVALYVFIGLVYGGLGGE